MTYKTQNKLYKLKYQDSASVKHKNQTNKLRTLELILGGLKLDLNIGLALRQEPGGFYYGSIPF